MNTPDQPPPETPPRPGLVQRALNTIEWAGTRLPDPAMLFVWALLLTLLTSAFLASVDFDAMDPRTVQRDAAGQITQAENIRVLNQLSGPALATFLARMVKTFIEFPPLGVVLVALLGVGVADQTGFISSRHPRPVEPDPEPW